MERSDFVRKTAIISMVMGVIAFVYTYVYLGSFPASFYGTIDADLYAITFDNIVGGIIVKNVLLIVYLLMLIIHICFIVISKRFKSDEYHRLYDALWVNLLVVALLVATQIIFIYTMPDVVNGEIALGWIQLYVPKLTDDVKSVFHIGLLLTFMYVVYNMFIAVKYTPKTEEEVED